MIFLPQLRLVRHVSLQPCLCSWVRNYAGGQYIPSIKFRYSGNTKASKSGVAPPPPSKESTAQAPSKRSATAAIEDWEIPKRFQRKRLSQEEVDYVNTGGPP